MVVYKGWWSTRITYWSVAPFLLNTFRTFVCSPSTSGEQRSVAVWRSVCFLGYLSSVCYLGYLSSVCFLGSVQFYSKFIPNLATVTKPLHQLTKKDIPWTWGTVEQAAFQKLKDLLCADNVLNHFNTSLPVGISCDASEVGLGAVLFHHYPDGSAVPLPRWQ